MNADQYFEKLKAFIESSPATKAPMQYLKEGVEIGLVIADSLQLALHQENGLPVLEQRVARSPDVIFYLKPEAVDVLCAKPAEDTGQFGIAVVKEILAGSIRVTVPGPLFNLLKNGYLGIIRSGGEKFLTFLTQFGLTTFSKLPTLLKKLKSRSRSE